MRDEKSQRELKNRFKKEMDEKPNKMVKPCIRLTKCDFVSLSPSYCRLSISLKIFMLINI